MKMRLECPECGQSSFELNMDVNKLGAFSLVCDVCGEPIATINPYSIDWVEDDEDAKDSD